MSITTQPGTISAATAEDAGRFLFDLAESRKAQGLAKPCKCPCGKPATTMLAGIVPVCAQCAHNDAKFGLRPRKAPAAKRERKRR